MSDFDAFVKKYEPMLQAMLPEYERHKARIAEREAEEALADKAEPFDSGVTDENRDEIYAPLVQPAPELPPFVPPADEPPAPEFKMAPEPADGAAAALEAAASDKPAAGAPEAESAASEEASLGQVDESPSIEEPSAGKAE